MCKNQEKQENWSKKYKDRGDDLKKPAIFLKENIECLKKGTVLDLACGDGRNAIFLAKLGFKVTGVDFSKEALKRLKRFSECESVNIEIREVDVDDVDEILGIGKFDNIIISNFKPTVEIFKVLPRLLNQHGILIFTTFNYMQAETSEFPRKYCLEENEFKDISIDLELLRLDSFREGEKHLDGYIFKKKADL